VSFPRNLKPWSLLSRVLSTRRDGFVEWVGEPRLLCVRLASTYGELEEGLAEIADAPPAAWHARSGTTGIGTVVAPISDGFLRAAARGPATVAPPIRDLLASGPFWVLPLAKRQAFSTERLTIGRSNTNDVVLRHASVSKHHAYVEYDEQDVFYVADEGSTNGTQIGGRTLAHGDLEIVGPGEIVRFGEVECVLVDAGAFWDLLHAET
jgi:hypothetical protein